LRGAATPGSFLENTPGSFLEKYRGQFDKKKFWLEINNFAAGLEAMVATLIGRVGCSHPFALTARLTSTLKIKVLI
jgi:hypothetical protein